MDEVDAQILPHAAAFSNNACPREAERSMSPVESAAAKRALTTPSSDTRRAEAAAAQRRPGAAPSPSRPSPRSRAAFGEWASASVSPECVADCCSQSAGAHAAPSQSAHTPARDVTPLDSSADLQDDVEYYLSDEDGARERCAGCDGSGVGGAGSCTCDASPWIHLFTRPSLLRAAHGRSTPATEILRPEQSAGGRWRPFMLGRNNTQGMMQGRVMVPAHLGVAGNIAGNKSRGEGSPGVRSRNGRPLPPGWQIVLIPNGKTKVSSICTVLGPN